MDIAKGDDMNDGALPSRALSQLDMVHRLPAAKVVDRIGWLVRAAQGRSVVHVGFVDAGCWAYHDRFEVWLHERLDAVAADLVGLDLDEQGVGYAVERGFAVHAVDACDVDAVRALELGRADLVIAGEVIEHVHASGPFLESMHELVRPGGSLVVTTPNASGLLNAGAAALVSREVNHPDHVGLFSCFTLSNLMDMHDWEVEAVATYVPELKEFGSLRGRMRVLGAGAKLVLGLERLLGRLGRPYAADGLIVSARSRR